MSNGIVNSSSPTVLGPYVSSSNITFLLPAPQDFQVIYFAGCEVNSALVVASWAAVSGASGYTFQILDSSDNVALAQTVSDLWIVLSFLPPLTINSNYQAQVFANGQVAGQAATISLPNTFSFTPLTLPTVTLNTSASNGGDTSAQIYFDELTSLPLDAGYLGLVVIQQQQGESWVIRGFAQGTGTSSPITVNYQRGQGTQLVYGAAAVVVPSGQIQAAVAGVVPSPLDLITVT
jgi:hypothetical protein